MGERGIDIPVSGKTLAEVAQNDINAIILLGDLVLSQAAIPTATRQTWPRDDPRIDAGKSPDHFAVRGMESIRESPGLLAELGAIDYPLLTATEI